MNDPARRRTRIARRIFAGILLLVLAGPALVACTGSIQFGGDWRTADRGPAGIAPDPAATPEAVVQIYAARAFNWRGIFAVHTWIATKAAGADHYLVHHVVGWGVGDGASVVVSRPDIPDRSWYGQIPEVLVDLRGPAAEPVIEAILAVIDDYPWAQDYTLWPGPNSNSFTAWVARRVPGLGLDLPPTAIGKDYLGGWRLVDRAPSRTGFQLSLLGLAGLTLAREEGLEVNLLGAAIGVNPFKPSLRLPGIGILEAD